MIFRFKVLYIKEIATFPCYIVGICFAAVEQCAEAAPMRRDNFHQVGADKGKRHRNLEGAKKLRKRLRQCDLPENRHLRCPQRAQNIAVFRLQCRQADGYRHRNREKGNHERDQDSVQIMLANKHQRDNRHNSGLWDGVETNKKRVKPFAQHA